MYRRLAIGKIIQAISAIILFFLAVGYMGVAIPMLLRDENVRFSLIFWTLLIIVNLNNLILLQWTQRFQNIYLYKIISNINKKEKKSMSMPQMIRDLVGKDVQVNSISSLYKGKLTEVDDEWIKVTKTTKKGAVCEFIIKGDMINAISVL